MEIRILIIAANALSQTSNNGKTYRSFLTGIPTNNVAQLYTGTNEYPDLTACSHYYRITDLQMLASFCKPWRVIHNTHENLLEAIGDKAPSEIEISSKFIKLRNLSKKISFLRELVWSTNKWDNHELREWIEEFSPTHIFAVLGNGPALHKVARKISRRYNIPLYVYFTDDYVINVELQNIIQRLYHKHIMRVYTKTLDQCKKAFVIGEKMKNAYRDFFRKEFGILVNGITFETNRPERIKIANDKKVVISYIGGIHLNRWKAIVKLARILNKMKEYSFDIRVFCIQKPNEDILKEFSIANVRYCGALTPWGVKDETSKSHIMLHVESFDDSSRASTHYSISTKIPEYMSSMRGIMAFGPHEVASIEIFSQNSIGCVLTDLDDEVTIEQKISQYLDSYNNLDFDYQYQFARKHFDKEKMQLIKQLL